MTKKFVSWLFLIVSLHDHDWCTAAKTYIVQNDDPTNERDLFLKGTQKEEQSTTLIVLDAMSRLFPFQKQFPRHLFKKMSHCFDQESAVDLKLRDVSDAAWNGFLEYGRSSGTTDDIWGTKKEYIEDNPTPLNDESIPGSDSIYVREPCNTISNVAYYRSMIGICARTNDKLQKWSISGEDVQAIVQAFSILTFGSCFNHGSQTKLGAKVDAQGIAIVSYIIYQATISVLPYETILYELQSTGRSYTGITAAEKASRVILEESVYNWSERLSEIDVPEYFISFSALIVLVLNLCLPEKLANEVTGFLASLLLQTDERRKFVIDSLQPAIQESLRTNGIHASPLVKAQIFPSFVGTMTKMIYAFLWQEWVLPIPTSIESNKLLNLLGAKFIPLVNIFGNTLTSFKRWSDPAFQLSFHVYPGSKICNKKANPHSKWHEVSANAFVDLVYLYDDVHRVLSGKKAMFDIDSTTDPMVCLFEHDCMDDFDLSSTTNESDQDDFPFSLMQSCIGTLMQADSRSNAGTWRNCIVMSLYTGRNDTIIEGIDTCLARNDCIAFDDHIAMDESRLIRCLGSDNESSCQQNVKEGKDSILVSCLLDCGSEMLCITACFQEHANLTPDAEKVLSCLNVLSSSLEDDEIDNAYLDECMFVPTSAHQMPSSSIERLAMGLPRLTECAVTLCRESFRTWNRATNGLQRCIAECSEETFSTVNVSEWIPPVSQDFACAMECLAFS